MKQMFPLNRKHGLGLVTAIATGMLVAAPARAGGGHTHETMHLGACLEQVQEIKQSNDFVKVEYLSVTEDGAPSFEIEVADETGAEWEFMCDATSGAIYEVEQEAESANDPRFKQNVKVSEQEATKMVTSLYAGEVKEIEYEIEPNGGATYEIDVVDKNDTEWKVEVDATTGDIIETHIEKWEIGEEPDEAGSR